MPDFSEISALTVSFLYRSVPTFTLTSADLQSGRIYFWVRVLDKAVQEKSC